MDDRIQVTIFCTQANLHSEAVAHVHVLRVLGLITALEKDENTTGVEHSTDFYMPVCGQDCMDFKHQRLVTQAQAAERREHIRGTKLCDCE